MPCGFCLASRRTSSRISSVTAGRLSRLNPHDIGELLESPQPAGARAVGRMTLSVGLRGYFSGE